MNRRSFLRFLAVAPIVAPAAVKAMAAPTPIQWTYISPWHFVPPSQVKALVRGELGVFYGVKWHNVSELLPDFPALEDSVVHQLE